jgi:hypothetical protein
MFDWNLLLLFLARGQIKYAFLWDQMSLQVRSVRLVKKKSFWYKIAYGV